MADLTLYYVPQSRSATALWMLEEIGEPYRLDVRRFDDGSLRTPDYLAINPKGKVPALPHDRTVVTEAAAICCHLADAFPRARLNVPLDDARRGPYLKWLFFGPSCFEPALIEAVYKREPDRGTLGWGNFELVLEVMENALAKGP